MTQLLAVVRIRGVQGLRWKAVRTLEQLRLTRRNHLVLLADSPAVRGMLKECKDYVAWGEAGEELVEKLKAKLGEQRVYRLHPARKGMKSVKLAFPKGVLGNHGKEISKLVERML